MTDPSFSLSLLPVPTTGPTQYMTPPGGRPPQPVYPSLPIPPPTIIPAQTGWTPAPSNLQPRADGQVAPPAGTPLWVKALLAVGVVGGAGYLAWKFKYAEEYAANDDDDGDEHYARNASVDFLTSDDDEDEDDEDDDDSEDGDDEDDDDAPRSARSGRREAAHRMVANSSPQVQAALEYASFCEAMKGKSTLCPSSPSPRPSCPSPGPAPSWSSPRGNSPEAGPTPCPNCTPTRPWRPASRTT